MNFRKLSFSEKEIIKNILKIIVIVIIFIFVEYLGFKLGILQVFREKKWLDPNFLIVGICFFLGFMMAVIFRFIGEKLDIFVDSIIWRLKNALKGNSGEKKTFARLGEIFGKEYRIYKNFKIPNTRFDNDLIVLGPKGLIYIEIKNITGNFDFIGEETYRHDRHHGDKSLCRFNEYRNPIKRVLYHCKAFERWLANNGFKGIILKRAIILVGDNVSIAKIENPAVYIISSLNNLASYIEKVYDDPLFTEEYCNKLDKLLSRK